MIIFEADLILSGGEAKITLIDSTPAVCKVKLTPNNQLLNLKDIQRLSDLILRAFETNKIFRQELDT